ncbi:DUF7282 domain-containing protein [Halorussus sp. AFM4]|uniref:DUF7282 domain-containing protein n=1 Tax=Halorussus sp. AFM4 TaxID=3421651 RepID=UPI003EB84BD1
MTTTRTVLAAAAVALLLVAGGGSGILAATGGTGADDGAAGQETTTRAETETTAGGAETTTAFVDLDSPDLTFDNQTSNGTAVTVSQAVLPDGGFVAVYLAENVSGNFTTLVGPENIGSRVGNSTYLGAGLSENVTIRLDRPLNESQLLIAVPHRDTNDNQQFDPALEGTETATPAVAGTTTAAGGEAMTTTAVQRVDAPYTQTPGGQPVAATAFVTVADGAAAGETTAAADETTTAMG